jgi:hypothetical protein
VRRTIERLVTPRWRNQDQVAEDEITSADTPAENWS